MVSVCIPSTFLNCFPSRSVCPGVLPILSIPLPEWSKLFFSSPFFDHVTWRRSFLFVPRPLSFENIYEM